MLPPKAMNCAALVAGAGTKVTQANAKSGGALNAGMTWSTSMATLLLVLISMRPDGAAIRAMLVTKQSGPLPIVACTVKITEP